MATKYSASLDVGEELDNESPKKKRQPLIDDSEPEQDKPSLEDDFNDLIRRELGEEAPKKPVKAEAAVEAPVIKIEPVKEVPKVDRPVKPVKEIKIEKIQSKPTRPEPKLVKAETRPMPKVEVKPEPKKVEQPKPKPEPKKVEVRVEKKPEVKKAEPKVEKKPTPKVESKRAEQKKTESKREPGSWSTRWAILIVLILIAGGAVYAVNALRNGKDAAALGCAAGFVDQKSGVSVSWNDASAVERYWLRQAFESDNELDAARIVHMLACDQAFLSTLSDPNGYSSCPTPATYLIVNEQALADNPVAALDNSSMLTKLASDATLKQFTLAYKLSDPSVRAWSVSVTAPIKTNSTKTAKPAVH
jgi:hypothetical protein